MELFCNQAPKKHQIKTKTPLPRLLSPRPAEARMSRPMREGEGPLVWDTAADENEEVEDTPGFSSPRRNLLASYMLAAFLSTLFTITDWGRTRVRKATVHGSTK